MSNIYYSPEKFGFQPVAEIGKGLSYEFDYLVVWRRIEDGQLFWSSDNGCSCPTPFENIGVEDLTVITLQDFSHFEKCVNDWNERYSPCSYSNVSDFLKRVKSNLKETSNTI